MIFLTREDAAVSEPTVVTLGNFDGFHTGHMRLINETLRISQNKNLKSVLFSFTPHAAKVLRDADLKLIFTQQEKKHIVGEMGLDIFYECEFTLAFARLSAEDFCELLLERLNPREIVVGSGYRFGYKGAGDERFLQGFCDKYRIFLTVMPTLGDKAGRRISSSLAREALAGGDWESFSRLIKTPYFIMPESVHERLATEYQLEIPEDKLVPAANTYAVLIKCGNLTIQGELSLPSGILKIPKDTEIPARNLISTEFIKIFFIKCINLSK